jgi:hypothetical protein
MEVSGQLHAPAGKSPRYPLYRRLERPHSWFGEEKCFALPGPEPGRPVHISLPYRLAVLNYAQGLLYLNFNNLVALVRERTIPTKRPPLAGKVITNFCG